jgi:hypothetical protein
MSIFDALRVSLTEFTEKMLLRPKSRLQTAPLFSSALAVNRSSEVDYHELE